MAKRPGIVPVYAHHHRAGIIIRLTDTDNSQESQIGRHYESEQIKQRRLASCYRDTETAGGTEQT